MRSPLIVVAAAGLALASNANQPVPTLKTSVRPDPATVSNVARYPAQEYDTTITATSYVYVRSTKTLPLSFLKETPATSVSVSTTTSEHTTAATPESNSAEEDTASKPKATDSDRWGITYTPYSSTGECKTAAEVAKDMARIQAKGFNVVRLYGTDCGTLESVGNAAQELNMHLIVGIFIDNKGIEAARKQVTDIASWGKFKLVDLVVVGNEAVFNGYVTAADLASFINEVRTSLKAKGYEGPITTAETLKEMIEYGSIICPVVDVAAANLQPFFNTEVTPERAGSFVKEQLDILSKTCGGKKAVNLECGWPTAGKNNGKAITGKDAQATALKSVLKEVGKQTIFFSYEDDTWKKPGDMGVEQHFGALAVF